MATLTAQQLHEFRTYLHNQAQAASMAVKHAARPADADYNRGRRLAYGDALAQFDELMADVVTVSLAPTEGGPITIAEELARR